MGIVGAENNDFHSPLIRNCVVKLLCASSGFLCRPYTYTLSVVDTFECFAQGEYFCVTMTEDERDARIRRDFRSVFPSWRSGRLKSKDA